MTSEILAQKLAWIASHLPRFARNYLETQFRKAWERLPYLEQRSWLVAYIDFTYAVTKHWKWHRASIFQDCALSSLQTDHGLALDHAKEFLSLGIAIISELSQFHYADCPTNELESSQVESDDQRFVFSIFSVLLRSDFSNEKLHELGLGREIVSKLESFLTDRDSRTHLVPSHLDNAFSEVFDYISSEMQRCRWATDRIQIALALDLSVKDSRLDEYLESLVHLDRITGRPSRRRVAFLEKLEAAGLSYPCGRNRFKITQAGYELTGAYLVSHFGNATFRKRYGPWQSLHYSWQKALLTDYESDSFTQSVLAVLRTLAPMHPEVLKLAALRLKTSISEAELSELLVSYVGSESALDVRKGALETLQAIGSEKLQPVCRLVLEQHSSGPLYDAAMNLLIEGMQSERKGGVQFSDEKPTNRSGASRLAGRV